MAEGVSGYDGTWVTGEWSAAGIVNGVSGRNGGVNGEGASPHAEGCIGLPSCLTIVSLISA